MEQWTVHFHRCIGSVHHFLVPKKNVHVVSYVVKFSSFSGKELSEQEKLLDHNLNLSLHLLCWNCLRQSPYSKHVSVSSNFSFISVSWWTGKFSCLYRVYVWVADRGVSEMEICSTVSCWTPDRILSNFCSGSVCSLFVVG